MQKEGDGLPLDLKKCFDCARINNRLSLSFKGRTYWLLKKCQVPVIEMASDLKKKEEKKVLSSYILNCKTVLYYSLCAVQVEQEVIEDYLQPLRMYLYFLIGCIAEVQACLKYRL